MMIDAEPMPGATMPEMDVPARPYGLIGLCVSLVAIAVIAAALCAVAGGVAALLEIVQSGWSGFVTELRTFAAARDEAATQLVLVLGSLLIYAALTAAVLIMARWRAGPAWRTLIAWHPWRPDWKFWLLAVGTLIYNIVVSAILAHVYPRSQDWVSFPHSLFGAGLFFLLAVVFAPVTEEILFRGWIYTNLKPRLGVIASVLIVSVIFALLHYESSHLYALAVFPVGVALTVVRERTDSLRAAMVFHAVFNWAAFGLAYLGAA